MSFVSDFSNLDTGIKGNRAKPVGLGEAFQWVPKATKCLPWARAKLVARRLLKEKLYVCVTLLKEIMLF